MLMFRHCRGAQRFWLSQAQFAALLGVSVRTLQEWEQGRREPTGAARTLLRVAVAHLKYSENSPHRSLNRINRTNRDHTNRGRPRFPLESRKKRRNRFPRRGFVPSDRNPFFAQRPGRTMRPSSVVRSSTDSRYKMQCARGARTRWPADPYPGCPSSPVHALLRYARASGAAVWPPSVYLKNPDAGQFNLETAAGRARLCGWAGVCREATRRQAGACNEARERSRCRFSGFTNPAYPLREQRQARDQTYPEGHKYQRVRSAVTQHVNVSVGRKLSIHAAPVRK